MIILKRIFDTKFIIFNSCNTFRKSFTTPAPFSIINSALYSNQVQSSVPSIFLRFLLDF